MARRDGQKGAAAVTAADYRRETLPAGQRRCTCCLEVKPETEFYQTRNARDGKVYRVGRCRTCYNAPRKKPPAQQSSEGRACTTCGCWKPWSEYNRNRRQASGHEPQCRQCSNARKRELSADRKQFEARMRDLRRMRQNAEGLIIDSDARLCEPSGLATIGNRWGRLGDGQPIAVDWPAAARVESR
jgi:hypothetical protein